MLAIVVVSVLVGGCVTPSEPGTPAAPSTTTITVAPSTSTTTVQSPPITVASTLPPEDVDLSAVRVLTDVRHDEQPSYVVDVAVPRLEGLDDTGVQDTVNAVMAGDLGAATDGFVDTFAGTETIDGAKSEWYVSFTVSLLDKGLFSVLVDFYEYGSGAAHGFSAVDGYIFDLADGTRLGLSDLTMDPDRLRDLIRQGIADQVYGGDRTPVGEFTSGRDLLDLARFALDGDGLVVSFDQYAVAAGAVGVVTVHVPYDALAIPEGSPVAALLR